MTEIMPCRMCGSPVREVKTKGEMSLADTTPPTVVKRVCTNPQCPSKMRDQSIADVV